jgi:dienelactone hydrolase
MNCRTDFQISIYPGPLGVPTGAIPDDAPAAFFLVANDDYGHVPPVLAQLEKYRAARRPFEVHLYAKGGHGFNMGTRSKLESIKGWPARMSDWLADSGFLNAMPETAARK